MCGGSSIQRFGEEGMKLEQLKVGSRGGGHGAGQGGQQLMLYGGGHEDGAARRGLVIGPGCSGAVSHGHEGGTAQGGGGA